MGIQVSFLDRFLHPAALAIKRFLLGFLGPTLRWRCSWIRPPGDRRGSVCSSSRRRMTTNENASLTDEEREQLLHLDNLQDPLYGKVLAHPDALTPDEREQVLG